MKFDQQLADRVIYMITKGTLVADRNEIGSFIGACVLGIFAQDREESHSYVDIVFDAYAESEAGSGETWH